MQFILHAVAGHVTESNQLRIALLLHCRCGTPGCTCCA